MKKITGSCLCGEVRYESSADPLMVVACHCKSCQKQSGTAFSVIVGVPAGSLATSGESLRTFEETGHSGQSVLRKFCSTCGSPLVSDVKSMPGILFIKAGTLDDTSWVEPSAEIWCDSRVSWGDLGDELPKMPGNPPAG